MLSGFFCGPKNMGASQGVVEKITKIGPMTITIGGSISFAIGVGIKRRSFGILELT